ncbi:MAG: hypothetical protein ACO1RA_20995 [Planctomycetaceae bacterium]
MRSFLLICFALAMAIVVSSTQFLCGTEDVKPKPLSVTFTYGHNGIIRTDDRFLAGEGIFATVVAIGYEIPANGICRCTMRYSLIDQDGKEAFSNADDKIIIAVEGGSNLAKVLVQFPLTELIDAGEYDFVLELQDNTTKELFRNSRPITILPKDEFALGDFCFCADKNAIAPIGTTFETCQNVFFCWRGYHLEEKDGHWVLDFDLDIFDANNKSIAAPSETIKSKIPVQNVNIFFSQIPITVEEPGEYTVVLKMTDVVSGKTETRSIPFRVIPSLSDILPAPAQ